MANLTDRQQKILNCIIREYVKHAEPVGSGLVCDRAGLDVSSATIRNDMQELENQGYLSQPHTSAGRIPTDKAYRHFVNALLEGETYDLDSRIRQKIDTSLHHAGANPYVVNRVVGDLLRELSDQFVITGIDQDNVFYKTGLSALLESPEFREIDHMFALTHFFDEFDTLFDEIERVFFGEDIPDPFRIFIGRENPMRAIRGETVIVGKYHLPQHRTGSITMIGPTRMDYGKNIALVRYTVHSLNKMSDHG